MILQTVSSISSSSAQRQPNLVVPQSLAVEKGTVWASAQSELQDACHGQPPAGAVSWALVLARTIITLITQLRDRLMKALRVSVCVLVRDECVFYYCRTYYKAVHEGASGCLLLQDLSKG